MTSTAQNPKNNKKKELVVKPKYYTKSLAKCACGAEFVINSSKPKFEIEICSQCHPFYTGNQKFIDTAGRVDRFYAKVKKARGYKESTG